MFSSVRTRLTLWYIGVLALVLISFGAGVYVMLARSLYAELDYDLKSTADGTAASLVREVGEGHKENETPSDLLGDHIGPQQAAAIFDASGQTIAENTDLEGGHVQLPEMSAWPGSQVSLYTINQGKGRRVALKRFTLNSPSRTYFIVVSQPIDRVLNRLRTIRLILFLGISGSLILAGLGGWFLARRSLAPMARMTEQARRMSAENLEQRLPVTNPHDELGRLAATFNELLARLDDALSQQRRFMADASHELRTPLSVMRTATSVTLEHDRGGEEYRDALVVIDEQARRLTRIVADMFTLARADTGQRTLVRSDFYLDELVEECVRAAEILGSRKGVRVNVEKFAETPYRGDEGLLRQLVLNLLDNAIKHTPANGEVIVKLVSRDSRHHILVSDTGSGIPADSQAHVFERFYRVDRARSRGEATDLGAGAGLGLSIARWIAETHQGRVELLRSSEKGSVFVASLPAN
jgi:two-component system, OmpR family, sensor kinase